MKMRFRQTSLLLALIGTWTPVGTGADALAAGKPAGCSANVDVMPSDLQGGRNQSCGRACDEQNNWIRTSATEYANSVRAACQKLNASLASLGENTQKGAQGNVKSIYSDGASAMGSAVDRGNQIKATAANKAKEALNKVLREPENRTHATNQQDLEKAKLEFNDKNKFDVNPLSHNPLEQNKAGPIVKNTAEFMHKLAADIKKQEDVKNGFTSAGDQAKANEDNSGANKDKDGKGMDMGQLAQLAGPLAGLAGMMQQKKASDAAAESGLSDPTAAAADAAGTSGASSTPAEATLGNSTVPGTSSSAGKSITDGGSSKTGTNSGKTATMEGGPGTASTASSGLSATPAAYQDAFTGFGKNGTTPGNYSSGGSSTSPSSGGSAGGGGAGSSPEATGRNAASASHSPAEEEALSSFGGGGLAFAGGSSGASHSSSGGDEPVKDFLQDAETAMGEGEFAAGPEGEVPAAEAGIEGEDGTELFRRVRSALERSQRKGTVMSGLSGPKDPRFR